MGGVRLVARTPRCGRGNASSILARRRHTFTTLLQHFHGTFMALTHNSVLFLLSLTRGS